MNQPMADLLRRELPRAGTLTSIEKATGVKRQSIAYFLQGKRSLVLSFADRLATYLEIECRVKAKRRKA